MMNQNIGVVLVCLFLVACSASNSPLNVYNHALLQLEAKTKECNQLEREPIVGAKGEGIDLDVLRVGLSYFYIKNAQECTESQKLSAIQAIENIELSEDVAEVIRFNAGSLKRALLDGETLEREQAKFDALSKENREALNKLSIAQRPFKVDLALEYYVKRSSLVD